MSVVGPRPHPLKLNDQFRDIIDKYMVRHFVRPGITGWAQILYPYGASINDAREKLQYDLYYVKNHSLLLDIVILFETVFVVLTAKGAR